VTRWLSGERFPEGAVMPLMWRENGSAPMPLERPPGVLAPQLSLRQW
jgi:hypothetical protein